MNSYKGFTVEHALGSVGQGWATIIKELWAKKSEGVRVTGIKEKYGSLRIYFDAPTREEYDAFELLAEAAEFQSETTCEFCGKPGVIREGGWLKCTCEEHKDWMTIKRT